MKSSLYTGTGDTGTTSLVDGTRARKDSIRIEAYGTVDEFSAFIGVVIAHKDCPSVIKEQLTDVQNVLFDVGAYLATGIPEGVQPGMPLLSGKIPEIEGFIDNLDEATPRIRSFVLPGGSELSAHCHVARTVCRRAERRILTLASAEYVAPEVITYFNRLSDYLFICARYVNHILGVEEITWKKAEF